MTGTIPPVGLAKICKEGVDAIGNALREWKPPVTSCATSCGTGRAGISDTEYVIYEQPQPPAAETPSRIRLYRIRLHQIRKTRIWINRIRKSPQNKYREIKYPKINYSWIKYRFHSFREKAAAQLPERKGRDAMSLTEMESYRDLILENIEYDHLCREFTTYREDLDEIGGRDGGDRLRQAENHPDRWQRLPP